MGLDIGGNQITQASSVLTVNTGVSMRILSSGPVIRPNQTQFIALGQGAAWIGFATSAWNKMPFRTESLNISSCYDTINSRFTAPVDGWYFFQASCYIVKNDASDGYYFHPSFAVNGALGGRAVNTAYPNYRIRGYGQPIGTYVDSQITEAYALVAGDYVEHYIYSSPGNNQYYGSQQRFTGFLLG